MSKIAEAMNPEAYGVTYPRSPGSKRTDTSRSAARSVAGSAQAMQARVLDLLRLQDMTTDEAAAELGASVLAIRPRFSELRAIGKIIDSGKRRRNESGRSAIVWRLA